MHLAPAGSLLGSAKVAEAISCQSEPGCFMKVSSLGNGASEKEKVLAYTA